MDMTRYLDVPRLSPLYERLLPLCPPRLGLPPELAGRFAVRRAVKAAGTGADAYLGLLSFPGWFDGAKTASQSFSIISFDALPWYQCH